MGMWTLYVITRCASHDLFTLKHLVIYTPKIAMMRTKCQWQAWNKEEGHLGRLQKLCDSKVPQLSVISVQKWPHDVACHLHPATTKRGNFYDWSRTARREVSITDFASLAAVAEGKAHPERNRRSSWHLPSHFHSGTESGYASVRGREPWLFSMTNIISIVAHYAQWLCPIMVIEHWMCDVELLDWGALEAQPRLLYWLFDVVVFCVAGFAVSRLRHLWQMSMPLCRGKCKGLAAAFRCSGCSHWLADADVVPAVSYPLGCYYIANLDIFTTQALTSLTLT